MKKKHKNYLMFVLSGILLIIIIVSSIILYKPNNDNITLKVKDYKYSEIDLLFEDIAQKLDSSLDELYLYHTDSILIENGEFLQFGFTFSNEKYFFNLNRYTLFDEDDKPYHIIEIVGKVKGHDSPGIIRMSEYLKYLKITNTFELKTKTKISTSFIHLLNPENLTHESYLFFSDNLKEINRIDVGRYIVINIFDNYEDTGSYLKQTEYYFVYKLPISNIE